MIKIKDKIKMLLWQIGFRKTIPASVINNIKIIENHDILVDIKKDKTLYFSDELKKSSSIYFRKQAYENLKKAQESLPCHYFFKIYSAFRSLKEQEELFNRKYQEIKEKYPLLSEDEITYQTKAVYADPRNGFGGHQTGGAVDISLCNENGLDYDMGTSYLEFCVHTPTSTSGLTSIQLSNRLVLKKSMENAGFKNYPNEWWHYCYGDRMWAAYSKQKICFYDMAEQPDTH